MAKDIGLMSRDQLLEIFSYLNERLRTTSYTWSSQSTVALS